MALKENVKTYGYNAADFAKFKKICLVNAFKLRLYISLFL